jgi:putative spermidine/putrescine transport system permease protein
MAGTGTYAPGLPARGIPRGRLDPLWLTAPGVLFLVILLLVPCARLLSASLTDVGTGGLSLAAFSRAFSVPVYVKVLSNTFWIAIQVTFLCLLLGYPLAYWLSRQPARRRPALTLLVLFPFWTSALVKNFSWIVVLGHTGPIGSLFHAFGLTPPELLFGRGTVIFGMVHTMLPLAVITMLPTLLELDQSLPRAASTLGARRAEVFWRINFHLSMPGVAAAGLLVFIEAIGFFITPALLGGPRDTMMGQLIIQQILVQQNWSFAGALGAMLIAAVLVACVVYDRAFGLSGLSGGTKLVVADRLIRRLGMTMLRWAARLTGGVGRVFGDRDIGWLLNAYAVTIIALLLLPILACVPMAFTSSTFLSLPPPGLSLRWFVEYFTSDVWVGATVNSFIIGFVVACLTLLLATPAALGMARARNRMSGAVFMLFLTPLIIPRVVTAVGLFYLLANIHLVATYIGIAIGHTVTALPLAVVILLAQLKQYEWRLNQAAETMGAGRLYTLRRIMVPLTRSGLIAAFIFAFLHSFEELTIALFVGGGLRVTLPRHMWDDVNLQVTPTLAAASVVVLAVVTILFVLAERLRPARA